MDMNMDVRFQIHGNPKYTLYYRDYSTGGRVSDILVNTLHETLQHRETRLQQFDNDNITSLHDTLISSRFVLQQPAFDLFRSASTSPLLLFPINRIHRARAQTSGIQ